MAKRIKTVLKLLLSDATPRIYSLQQCTYIRWLGYEWIIPKVGGHR